MGEIETNEFNNTYSTYHLNDKSLICQNNTLYYNGETKYFFGFVGISKGEKTNIGDFPIRNIDPNIWRLDSQKLFFNLRESIKFYNSDNNFIKNRIYDFLSLASKNNLTEYEKSKLIYEIDYYLSLNSIENTLRNELYDYYRCFNEIIIPQIISANKSDMSEGFKIINQKLYNIVLNKIDNQSKDLENDNNSNEKGHSRTLIGPAGKSKKNPLPLSFYQDNDINNTFNTGAYINAFIIIFLVLSLIFILMLVFTR